MLCIAVAAISFLAFLRAFKAAEQSSNLDAVDRPAQKRDIGKFIAAALSIWLIASLWLTRGGPWAPRLVGTIFLGLIIVGQFVKRK